MRLLLNILDSLISVAILLAVAVWYFIYAGIALKPYRYLRHKLTGKSLYQGSWTNQFTGEDRVHAEWLLSRSDYSKGYKGQLLKLYPKEKS